MGDLKEYADRLKFEIMAADFLTTEDREMVFDLIEKVLGDDNARSDLHQHCAAGRGRGYRCPAGRNQPAAA